MHIRARVRAENALFATISLTTPRSQQTQPHDGRPAVYFDSSMSPQGAESGPTASSISSACGEVQPQGEGSQELPSWRTTHSPGAAYLDQVGASSASRPRADPLSGSPGHASAARARAEVIAPWWDMVVLRLLTSSRRDRHSFSVQKCWAEGRGALVAERAASPLRRPHGLPPNCSRTLVAPF